MLNAVLGRLVDTDRALYDANERMGALRRQRRALTDQIHLMIVGLRQTVRAGRTVQEPDGDEPSATGEATEDGTEAEAETAPTGTVDADAETVRA